MKISGVLISECLISAIKVALTWLIWEEDFTELAMSLSKRVKAG